jgi:hypothetical protein
MGILALLIYGEYVPPCGRCKLYIPNPSLQRERPSILGWDEHAEARSQRWQVYNRGDRQLPNQDAQRPCGPLFITVKSNFWKSLIYQKGPRCLVTVLPDGDDETEFWSQASQPTLDAVWDNTEDDVYGQLLEA